MKYQQMKYQQMKHQHDCHKSTLQPLILALAFGLLVAWLAPARAAVPVAERLPPGAVLPGATGYVLVKDWNFGAAPDNTIRDMGQMNDHFQYHDQFGTIANGTNYGSLIVAPDAGTALRKQPVEGDSAPPVRQFLTDALRTRVVPLNGSTTVHPEHGKAGAGSFQAKWTLARGGAHLGCDLLWETRVRYQPVPYFWFAIWTAGNIWRKGAEIDVVESFGYDNGGGYRNFDGTSWHSGTVGGVDHTRYEHWRKDMTARGVGEFDPSQWHVWSLLYRADDSFSVRVDDHEVQSGNIAWTVGGKADGPPLNMSFIFDGSWGHTKVDSVNHELSARELARLYYDWDYSRIYLKCPTEAQALQLGREGHAPKPPKMKNQAKQNNNGG